MLLRDGFLLAQALANRMLVLKHSAPQSDAIEELAVCVCTQMADGSVEPFAEEAIRGVCRMLCEEGAHSYVAIRDAIFFSRYVGARLRERINNAQVIGLLSYVTITLGRSNSHLTAAIFIQGRLECRTCRRGIRIASASPRSGSHECMLTIVTTVNPDGSRVLRC